MKQFTTSTIITTLIDIFRKTMNYSGMDHFIKFNQLKHQEVESKEVQDQVKELQSYLSKHFYLCTKDILSGLGQMYAEDGEFTKNIDAYAGKGTAIFTSRAIAHYCHHN